MVTPKKCPCCDTELKAFSQFPRILVQSFEVLPIPDVVPVYMDANFKLYEINHAPKQLRFWQKIARAIKGTKPEPPNPDFPAEIIEQLRKQNDPQYWLHVGEFVYQRSSHEEHEFFEKCINRAGLVRQIMQGDEVRGLFEKIGAYVGKKVDRKEIMPWPKAEAFGYCIPGRSGDATISLEDYDNTKTSHHPHIRDKNESGLGFILHADIHYEGTNLCTRINLPVAKMKYEGILRKRHID